MAGQAASGGRGTRCRRRAARFRAGPRLAGPARGRSAAQGRSPLTASPGSVLLRAEGVVKAFGGVQALDGCTVDVTQGSITGLIGPNGSGKTTLFNVITGYERLDSGDVYLDD